MPTQIFSYDKKEKGHDFKQLVIDYLKGKDIREINTELTKICTSSKGQTIGGKELCKEIDIADDDNSAFDAQTNDILLHLTAPLQKGDYTGSTSLYHLLKHLRNEGHEHLDFLIELIDSKQVPGNWIDYIIPPAFTILGGLGFCYFQPQFFWSTLDWALETLPIIYHWLYYHIIQLHCLPLFGMGGQALLGIYYSWHTFEYGFDQSDKRIRRWLFNTIAVLLNLLAYLISYWAAGTLPLLPAVLFITASFIYIFEGIYTDWQLRHPSIQSRSNDTDIDTDTKAHKIRQKHFKERDKQLNIIRSIYALLVTLLVIASYLIPGNVILTIAYTLSLWLVQLIKESLLNREIRNSAVVIQKALNEHYKAQMSDADRLRCFRIENNTSTSDGNKNSYLEKTRHSLIEQINHKKITLDEAKKQLNVISQHWDSIIHFLDNPSNSLNNSMIAR